VLFDLFPVVTIALFFEDLEAAYLFRRHIAPRNTEVRCVKLQFEDPFEQSPGNRVRPDVIEVV